MPVNQLESWISLQIEHPRKTILTRKALRKWQKKKLLQIIDLARKHSPWHRERLQEVFVPENGDIEHILHALPLTTADDLRTHGQDMLCCSLADIQRVVTLQSSGTSGRPKRIFFTAADLEKTKEFFQHGMRLVAGPGDTVLIMLPSERDFDVGTLLLETLNRAGFSALVQWPAHDPQRVAEAAGRIKANCLIGMPQHILPVARDPALAQQVAPSLRSVLLCSDYAAPCVRQTIAGNLDCRVHLHYGLTESGLGGAVECRAGQGCHIRENDLLFEVIDPRSGVAVSEGHDGELVFSTLTRTGMPLLRYRTGDWGRLNFQRCSCGSILARLENLQGRLDNVLYLPGEEKVSLHELDQALLALPGITSYTARLQNCNVHSSIKGDTLASNAELAIEITTLPNPQSYRRESVRAAVSKIPAVHRALTSSGLSLSIARTEKHSCPGHTVKRTLMNTKNQPDGKIYAGTP
jgi:phenylacetate-coenzyme A ligase PaaK-like adenylate-forming protein